MALRRTAIAIAGPLALLLGGTSLRALPPPAAPPISGVVSHMEKPIAGALVVFYNVADLTLTRSRTATDGTFVVASAPVGVYDLVAYKRGFVPALVRIWHQNLPDSVSAVHIQLSARKPETASDAASPDASLWELRDRLPDDVLREITMEEGAGAAPGAALPKDLRIDRSIAAEVRTVANVASNDASLSRAAVGVHGGLPNGWQYNLRGDYAAVSDSTTPSPDVSTTGNAAGLALDVDTSSQDHVTLDTRRHTLMFRDDGPASLQSHGASWSRDGGEGSVESVAARYVEETNLYRATSAGTLFFPLASRTWEVNAQYARPATDGPGVAVAMTYRHREGTVGPSGVGSDGAFLMSAPDADLSAATVVNLSSRMHAEAGVVARYLGGGYGIAPAATVRYDVDGHTTVFVRGLVRVQESATGTGMTLPLVASVDANSEATSRKGFSAGVQRKNADGSTITVEASNQRVSEAVRAFFEGDFLTDFDSIYLFDGNMVRQYRLVGARRLSDKLTGSISGRYASIDGEIAPESAASFGVTGNPGHFWSARAAIEVVPTGTGVALLVRGAKQQLQTASAPRSNDSAKVAVSVAQDLSVVGITPFGSVWKLLIALESARTTATTEHEEVATKRLLGGVAISF